MSQRAPHAGIITPPEATPRCGSHSTRGAGRFLFQKYPNPDSRSLPPQWHPSPFFVASLIFLAIGGGLFWLLHSALTRPLEVERDVLAFEQVVRPSPPDCAEAADYYDCLNYRGPQ